MKRRKRRLAVYEEKCLYTDTVTKNILMNDEMKSLWQYVSMTWETMKENYREVLFGMKEELTVLSIRPASHYIR